LIGVGVYSHAATGADAVDKSLPLATNQEAICRYVGVFKRSVKRGENYFAPHQYFFPDIPARNEFL